MMKGDKIIKQKIDILNMIPLDDNIENELSYNIAEEVERICKENGYTTDDVIDYDYSSEIILTVKLRGK